jgi:hypothetical protein
MVAAIHFQPLGDEKFRAHVEASARDVLGLREEVRRACYGAGFYLFEHCGAQEFECLIPRWQKVNMAIARACGMKKTGEIVDLDNGTQAVEFKITREDFIKEHQWRADGSIRNTDQLNGRQ